MKIAILGLPKSGMSTVFAAITGNPTDPYAPPEPRRAIVKVPDERLIFLAELYQPKKVTEATIEFVDVPGCAIDDAQGRDAWRRLLPTVRQAELLVLVVRDFENVAVPATGGRVDARRDFDALWEEILFADLDGATTRIERIEKALKRPTKTHEAEKAELAILTRCQTALEGGAPLASVLVTEEDRRQVASFGFLSEKPMIGVVNVSDDRAAQGASLELPHARSVITLSASIEAEIALLDPADRPAFLSDLGLEATARDRLIRTCYEACGLISFLTASPEEVRAWTIRRGATAVEAASKVHSDLARGFIRAETVAFEDLVAHEDMKGAKAAGRVRKEGKSYVVQDGDVMLILANP